MKRVLLGTTAIVAAAAFASGAMADEMMEEPISVGLSGYAQSTIGFASDGGDGKRGHDIGYVIEFGVSGSTTLDNGITVGVSGQLGRSSGADTTKCNVIKIVDDGEGNCGGGTDFDEVHTTLSGAFGAVRIGRTESAAFNATVPAPGGGVAAGVNYVWFSTAAPTVNTWSGIGVEDAMKVVYTSPNFNGLTVGVSYAPEDTENLGGDREIGAEDKATGHTGLGAHTAVGVTYSTEFMAGGSVTLGAGYEVADNEAGGDDPSAMRFGINVGIDQISIGGSMFDHDVNGVQYDVGAGWSEGPLGLGVQYAADDDDNTGMAALHVNYNLGPGVDIGAQLANGSSDTMDDVVQFMIGTSIGF